MVLLHRFVARYAGKVARRAGRLHRLEATSYRTLGIPLLLRAFALRYR